MPKRKSIKSGTMVLAGKPESYQDLIGYRAVKVEDNTGHTIQPGAIVVPIKRGRPRKTEPLACHKITVHLTKVERAKVIAQKLESESESCLGKRLMLRML